MPEPTDHGRPGRPGGPKPTVDLRCKARRGKDRCELAANHGNVHRVTWID